jgi:hypothetical protein
VSEIDLEETAIAFFRAIRASGKNHLGHDRFGFKLDIKTMAPVEDREAAELFGANLQEALTNASKIVQPVTIETSLQ